MGTVAPVAAQLGVSVEDLVGSMAILSRTNSNTAENATSLGQIFNTLLKPTDQTSAALQKMGLSAAGLRDELSEKGVIAVLKTLGEHIGTDDEAIAQIFPNIRALRGVLNLTGQDAGAVAEAMDKVGHSTGALDDAVKAVADDATVKMNKAVAGLQVELIVLASDVLPLVVRMLGGLVTGIHGAVEWFTKLPVPVKEGAVTALALLAVLGPILIVLGSIVTAGTAVLGAFGTLAGFLGATLIPRFVTLLAMLAGGAVQGFASLIFATGIPALESLGVALAGVEVAAGPLLAVAAALIAIGVAASGAAPSVDDIKKQIADLEKEDGLAKFLDVNRDGRIEFLKQKLAEAEAAVAAAAAKEREQLAASQKAWADWQAEVGTTIDDIATHLGLGGVPDAVHGMVDDVAQGLKSGKYKIENGAIVMAEGIPTAVEKSGLAAVKAVKTTIGDIARAIRASRQVIVDAMTDVVNDAYDPLILAADISATKVELAEQRKIAASKGYTQAQVDAAKAHARTDAQREKADKMHTVAEVAEAKRRVLELQKQLGIQLADQTKYGDDATRLGRLKAVAVSKAMVDGLKSGDTLRKAESQKAAAELASGIVALEKSSGGYGTRTGNSYVDSLISALENKYAETKRAVGIYKNLLVASSPPGPDSPLHEIPKWGYRTGEAWVSPFGDAIAAGHARIRALVGGIRGDLDVAGGGSASLGRIERMGSIRVEHTISADGAAALAAAGLDPRQVGQALADGVNASGLFSNLQGLQALSGS
jgi:hypothetical protein